MPSQRFDHFRMLYDAHNHLQDEWLAPHLDRIASAVDDLSIRAMVVNGTNETDWSRVAELAQRFPFVRPSYGLHPWHVGNRSPDWLERLRAQLADDPHAAIGEIGIDRWMLDNARDDDLRLAGLRRAPLDEQTDAFLSQLTLAAEENRPVTIHCLQAFGALDELLHSHAVPQRGFLLHAYGGPAEMVTRFADAGAYFSFNGYFLKDTHPAEEPGDSCRLINDKPAKRSRLEPFKIIPLDRLLVETDAPGMSPPQSWRSHKLPPSPEGATVNHPGNLDAAYAGLAALRGIPVADLTKQVAENFTRLFG